MQDKRRRYCPDCASSTKLEEKVVGNGHAMVCPKCGYSASFKKRKRVKYLKGDELFDEGNNK